MYIDSQKVWWVYDCILNVAFPAILNEDRENNLKILKNNQKYIHKMKT